MPISNVTNRRFPDKLAQSETGTPWAVSDQPENGRFQAAAVQKQRIRIFCYFLRWNKASMNPPPMKHSRRGRFRNNGNAVNFGSQLAGVPMSPIKSSPPVPGPRCRTRSAHQLFPRKRHCRLQARCQIRCGRRNQLPSAQSGSCLPSQDSYHTGRVYRR